MDYNIHKICRVCLEEGAVTSIFSTEFAMMPSTMLMLVSKVRVGEPFSVKAWYGSNVVSCRFIKWMDCHQLFVTTAFIAWELHIISSKNVKIPTFD